MDDSKLLAVFSGIERDVIAAGARNRTPEAFRADLERLDNLGTTFTDEDIFRRLVMVIFYSGFKAETVSAKRAAILRRFPNVETVAAYSDADARAILADEGIIRNEKKIRACVANARVFRALAQEHGSVAAYIASFRAGESFENLFLLKEELEARLEYIGGVTVYHFMTDIGLPVLKPDRVICRLFARLGLLENERQFFKAVLVGRRIAALTNHSNRYVDRILVAHGQVAATEHAVGSAVCLKVPRCSDCSVRNLCPYGLARR